MWQREAIAKKQGVPVDDILKQRTAIIPAGRLGDPAEFGDACAYLCSKQAGYITGLNVLMDGGRYKGAA